MALPTFEQTRLETWFERDRANVRLVHEGEPDNDLLNLWDEDVLDAFEDGFFDRRNLHQSAYDWWRSLQG